MIESPTLARAVARGFAERLPEQAYEVRLEPDGSPVWIEQRGGEVIRHGTEPGTSALQRTLIELLSHLPIEWLL